ncbi:hypothetical protein KR026_001464, partial [Drosophila bipectinata]
ELPSVAAENGQTEHQVSEEWSWRDSDGNNGSGSSEYSYVDDMRNVEDYEDEDDLEEDEDEDDGEDDFDNVADFEMDDNEDEDSCEYSCPRYYRPVCVLRNGHMVTYATPCEYHNQVRCSIVQKSRGGARPPTFEFWHTGSC